MFFNYPTNTTHIVELDDFFFITRRDAMHRVSTGWNKICCRYLLWMSFFNWKETKKYQIKTKNNKNLILEKPKNCRNCLHLNEKTRLY
jgi:hypothetical protein